MEGITFAIHPSPNAHRFMRDGGRVKLDLTRRFVHGKCALTAYALVRGYRSTVAREWLAHMMVPTTMSNDDVRTALATLGALAAMHIGEDYVIRHMTKIKGETK